MFSGTPQNWGRGGGGNSGAQAILSASALINSDGLRTRLIVHLRKYLESYVTIVCNTH